MGKKIEFMFDEGDRVRHPKVESPGEAVGHRLLDPGNQQVKVLFEASRPAVWIDEGELILAD